jgi:hypothetical protein
MRTRIAALPGLVLIAIAMWEIVATVRAAREVPHDDAWAEAAAIVRRTHRPGDLIVFAPAWTDPIGRHHLGDLIPIDMAARMDADRYGTIWELSIRGAHAPEVAGLVPVETFEAFGVEVNRYQRTPVHVLADVRERLDRAQFSGGMPRLDLTEVGFQPHRCILVTPPPGKPAIVLFPRLPLGRQLVGYVGIADVFTRRDERSGIILNVELGGRVVTTVRAGVEDGWVRFAVPTTPGQGEVAFVAQADKPGKQVCFAAETRE